jgi:hypothetical protein
LLLHYCQASRIGLYLLQIPISTTSVSKPRATSSRLCLTNPQFSSYPSAILEKKGFGNGEDAAEQRCQAFAVSVRKAEDAEAVSTFREMWAKLEEHNKQIENRFDLSDIARRYSVISITEDSCLVLVLPTVVKVSNQVQKLSNKEEAAAVSDARIWTKCTVGKLQRDTTFRVRLIVRSIPELAQRAVVAEIPSRPHTKTRRNLDVPDLRSRPLSLRYPYAFESVTATKFAQALAEDAYHTSRQQDDQPLGLRPLLLRLPTCNYCDCLSQPTPSSSNYRDRPSQPASSLPLNPALNNSRRN